MTENIIDLGLSDKPEASDGHGGFTESNHATPVATVSPTAMKIDQWGLRQGCDLIGENETAQKIFKLDELDAKDENVKTILSDATHSAADFFNAMFAMHPEMAENCTDDLRHKFIKEMMDTNEYRSLHTQTRLNHATSKLAALSFASQFCKLREDVEGDSPGDGEGAPEGNEFKKDIRCLNAVGAALKEASNDVKDMNDAMSALGIGGAEGDGTADAKKIAETFKLIRNNGDLRRICELAGRYRRMARAKQRMKVKHGQDDVVGVEMGGDIARILPQELALLSCQETELDVMRRIVERQVMCREFNGVERKGKGPIVVVCDESGSMDGEPNCNSKAFALTMAWIARHQNRWCALVGFSGGKTGHSIVLQPKKWDETKLLEWLAHFYGEGTTMDVPLNGLPFKLWPKFIEQGMQRGATDVILITDAQVRVPNKMIEKFNQWKADEQVTAYGIIIEHRPGDMEKVCDKTWRVNGISMDETAIGELMEL